jgi:hypothetical protein
MCVCICVCIRGCTLELDRSKLSPNDNYNANIKACVPNVFLM